MSRFASSLLAAEPPADCGLCPRLVAVRATLRHEQPGWWNAPVPAWGDPDAAVAIVGLAPGRHGANRTGRPFIGDAAGALLFRTLLAHGLAAGTYGGEVEDDLRLNDTVILNAVRCLPPGNAPTSAEIRACRPFLDGPLTALSRLRVVVALGRVAHDATVRAFGGRPGSKPFGHGREYPLPNGATLLDSYHCSRYNQNTGRLTDAMLAAVVGRACAIRDAEPQAAVGR